MTTKANPLEPFTAAWQKYAERGDEASLSQGYHAARQALIGGAGFFDLLASFQQSFGKTMTQRMTHDELMGVVVKGLEFLVNALAPLEMIVRGYRETAERLRHVNETLEAQVEERTRQLNLRVTELSVLNQKFQEHLTERFTEIERYQDLTSKLGVRLQEMASFVASTQASPQTLERLVKELLALAEQARSQPDLDSPQKSP